MPGRLCTVQGDLGSLAAAEEDITETSLRMPHRLTCFLCASRNVIIMNFIAVPCVTNVCHGLGDGDVAGRTTCGEAESLAVVVLRDAVDAEPIGRVLLRGEDATHRRVIDAFRAEGIDKSSEFLGGVHVPTIPFSR